MLIEHSIIIRSDIHTVWEIFTDFTCWKSWNSVAGDVSADCVTLTEGTCFCFCLRPFAVPIYIKPIVESVNKHRYIAWTGSKHGILARHEFLFNEVSEGVKLTSRETFSAGPLSTFLFRFSKGPLKKLSVKMLRELKSAAESDNLRQD